MSSLGSFLHLITLSEVRPRLSGLSSEILTAQPIRGQYSGHVTSVDQSEARDLRY